MSPLATPTKTQVVEGRFINEDFTVSTGRITFGNTIQAVEQIGNEHSPVDTSLTWVPGFVDLHNHGGFGGSFPNGSIDECRGAAHFHLKQGTTTLLASLVSGTRDELCRQASVLAQLGHEGTITGIHMEGPFLAKAKCGAQDPSRITAGDPDFFRAVVEAAEGHLASITFAPETAHADELLAVCAEHNIIASLGHTEASYEETWEVIRKANELGVRVTATHLFNAMPPLHHRSPGPIAALLNAGEEGHANLELIADGVHLADGTVDLAYSPAAFAVTDSMEAAGMKDGRYQLGSLAVTVDGGVARVDAGAIAGGTSTLAQQCARFARRKGLGEAARFTSATAAGVLGRTDIGRITPGVRADLVGLDKDMRPVQVFRNGVLVD